MVAVSDVFDIIKMKDEGVANVGANVFCDTLLNILNKTPGIVQPFGAGIIVFF